MSDTNEPNFNDEQLQAAWEKLLRGEAIDTDGIDQPNRETAEALRRHLMGLKALEEPVVDELEQAKIWKKLSAQIHPSQEVDNSGGENSTKNSLLGERYKKPRTRNHWWMGMAACLMVALVAVQVWRTERGTPNDLSTIKLDPGQVAYIEKSTRSGMGIFAQVLVDDPAAYTEQLKQDLLQVGFQIKPIDEEDGDYLVSLRAKGEVSEVMQAVLDRYNIVLDHGGGANLRIGKQ